MLFFTSTVFSVPTMKIVLKKSCLHVLQFQALVKLVHDNLQTCMHVKSSSLLIDLIFFFFLFLCYTVYFVITSL